MKIRNLFERTDLQSGLACDRSLVGFLDAADDLQKCGLAGAIRANQADLFGWIDLE